MYATGILTHFGIQEGPSLPYKIGAVTFGKTPMPGEPCLVQITFKGCEGRYADFDFTLVGNDGSVILQADDYRIVWLT